MTQAVIYLKENPRFLNAAALLSAHVFWRMTVRLGAQTDSFLEMGHDN